MCEEASPEFIFAENSDRLRTKGLRRIVLHLQGMGYCRISYLILGATQVGAPHLRKRMWLLAAKGGSPAELPPVMPFAGTVADGLFHEEERIEGPAPVMPTLISADARGSGNRPDPTLWSLSDTLGITKKFQRHGITMPTIAATDWKSKYSTEGLQKQLAKRSKPLRDVLPFIEGGTCINPRWAEWYMGWPLGWTDLEGPCTVNWAVVTKAGNWWTDQIEEQVLPRTLTKRPKDYADRIFALGNGQVPLCAAVAFQMLMERVS